MPGCPGAPRSVHKAGVGASTKPALIRLQPGTKDTSTAVAKRTRALPLTSSAKQVVGSRSLSQKPILRSVNSRTPLNRASSQPASARKVAPAKTDLASTKSAARILGPHNQVTPRLTSTAQRSNRVNKESADLQSTTTTSKPRRRLLALSSAGTLRNHHSHQQGAKASSETSLAGEEGATALPVASLEPAMSSRIEQLEDEKHSLNERVLQLQDDLHSQQVEVARLQAEMARVQSERGAPELESLRGRLQEGAALCDTEKELLLQQRNAVAATTPQGDGDGCSTPDWDKRSSSSLSEVSVACLQDRILQMEETHYSTNEELQATLQELSDLQAQLTDLQSENERLHEEKAVLLETLCHQGEKLESLQQLVIRNSGTPTNTEPGEHPNTEELVKSMQDERTRLERELCEVKSHLSDTRGALEEKNHEIERLQERIGILEGTLETSNAEKRLLETELSAVRQEASSSKIEINRLVVLLDNARSKIDELQAERELGDKSELDELLDDARKEKDDLETKAAVLQDKLARSQCEVSRLKEQFTSLQEEYKVARNNAKSVQSDFEYRLGRSQAECRQTTDELRKVREAASELQIQCQQLTDDKLNLTAALADSQRRTAEAQQRASDSDDKLAEEKRQRQEEKEEWAQFQSDLLMTVRVANDFKTEAQQHLERLVLENKQLKERARYLEGEIEKGKATPENNSVLSLVQKEVAETVERRKKAAATRSDSRLSVKTLVESIENAGKPTKTASLPCGTVTSSRPSSTSSMSSITSGMNNSAPSTPISPTAPTITAPLSNIRNTETKTPLRDQQNNQQSSLLNRRAQLQQQRKSSTDGLSTKTITDPIKASEDVTPVCILNNKMDFLRRNSYGDLTERKDPLTALVKKGDSKRNALLNWCQNKTVGYRGIEITNFSSSWTDGLALCALLHTYLPDKVPWETLSPNEKRRNFQCAFAAAESVGIPTTLNISEMIQVERPDWQQVMAYVTSIYKHFET